MLSNKHRMTNAKVLGANTLWLLIPIVTSRDRRISLLGFGCIIASLNYWRRNINGSIAHRIDQLLAGLFVILLGSRSRFRSQKVFGLATIFLYGFARSTSGRLNTAAHLLFRYFGYWRVTLVINSSPNIPKLTGLTAACMYDSYACLADTREYHHVCISTLKRITWVWLSFCIMNISTRRSLRSFARIDI